MAIKRTVDTDDTYTDHSYINKSQTLTITPQEKIESVGLDQDVVRIVESIVKTNNRILDMLDIMQRQALYYVVDNHDMGRPD